MIREIITKYLLISLFFVSMPTFCMEQGSFVTPTPKMVKRGQDSCQANEQVRYFERLIKEAQLTVDQIKVKIDASEDADCLKKCAIRNYFQLAGKFLQLAREFKECLICLQDECAMCKEDYESELYLDAEKHIGYSPSLIEKYIQKAQCYGEMINSILDNENIENPVSIFLTFAQEWETFAKECLVNIEIIKKSKEISAKRKKKDCHEQDYYYRQYLKYSLEAKKIADELNEEKKNIKIICDARVDTIPAVSQQFDLSIASASSQESQAIIVAPKELGVEGFNVQEKFLIQSLKREEEFAQKAFKIEQARMLAARITQNDTLHNHLRQLVKPSVDDSQATHIEKMNRDLHSLLEHKSQVRPFICTSEVADLSAREEVVVSDAHVLSKVAQEPVAVAKYNKAKIFGTLSATFGIAAIAAVVIYTYLHKPMIPASVQLPLIETIKNIFTLRIAWNFRE